MIALKPAFDANNLISLFYKIVKGDFEVSGEHSILMRMFREKYSGLSRTIPAQISRGYFSHPWF